MMPLDDVQERQDLDDLLARLRAEDEAVMAAMAPLLAEDQRRTEELLAQLQAEEDAQEV